LGVDRMFLLSIFLSLILFLTRYILINDPPVCWHIFVVGWIAYLIDPEIYMLAGILYSW